MITSIVITPEAEEDIDRIDAWWSQHRAAAPNLFFEEIGEAFAQLALWPEMGRIYAGAGVVGVRRLLLRATKHHVYYSFDGVRVTILTVWSAARGRGPVLKLP